MKKTVITTLLLLASIVSAAEWVTSTTPEYNDNQGGKYAGITFNLGNLDANRAATTGVGEMTPLVGLYSISLTERLGNDMEADRVLYVTNSSNVYLGSSALFTKAEGSDVAVFNFNNSITLSTNETYYAYLTTASSVENWSVGSTTVPTGQYYSSQLAAAGAGGLDSETAKTWGLLNAQKGVTSTTYAPVMSIVTTEYIPEPATATLSLLALAGLAARRRRR